MFNQKIQIFKQIFKENAKLQHFSINDWLQTLPSWKPLHQCQNFKKLLSDLHIGFIFCFMAIFVQPMQPPLEQPLRGRPIGPIYVTLVESTLFDGKTDAKTKQLLYKRCIWNACSTKCAATTSNCDSKSCDFDNASTELHSVIICLLGVVNKK